MSVYMIIDIQVKDNEMYSKYIEKVPEIISNLHSAVEVAEDGILRYP